MTEGRMGNESNNVRKVGEGPLKEEQRERGDKGRKERRKEKTGRRYA